MTRVRLILLLLLLSLSTGGMGFEPLELDDNWKSGRIYKMELFEDANDSFDVFSVQTAPFFKYDKKEVPNLGINDATIWIRFQATGASDDPEFYLRFAYSLYDEIAFYQFDEKGTLLKKGDVSKSRPFHERSYPHPNGIFRFEVNKGETHTFYLAFKNLEQSILPLYIVRATQLSAQLKTEYLVVGVISGILIIMFVYNLFVYISVKDRNYLYYIIYILFLGLTQISITGVTYQYLWPNWHWIAIRSSTLFPSIAGFFGFVFAISFLNLENYLKRVTYVAIYPLMIAFILSSLFSIFGLLRAAFILMQATTMIGAFILLAVSIRVYLKGFSSARYFIFAWSILLLSAVVFILKDYGVLPYNLFTNSSVQIGASIELALLSFALADKINQFKRENELANLERLELERKNSQMVRNQNKMLEKKVAERTHELNEKNDELVEAYESLKSAQTKLVSSEKMVSLGQLTAGIAHEINNPINFVSANIGPLRRDVGDLIELFESTEEILKSGNSEDAEQIINEMKEDVEYDYIKNEIEELLRGMSDGTSRTVEIVRGLKTFSRVDENDEKIVDLHEGIDSTLVLLNNSLKDSVVVEKEYGDLPKVECFPGKINQVFMNIINNAGQALKKSDNEERGIIKIKSWRDEKNVFISIKDNGPGIPDEIVDKIFDPFFTTKAVGEGTGLGLSIVYTIIQSHSGKIDVISEPGKGAEFIISLPITSPKNDERQE
jgi:two-component system NtrC family sensor kinase